MQRRRCQADLLSVDFNDANINDPSHSTETAEHELLIEDVSSESDFRTSVDVVVSRDFSNIGLLMFLYVLQGIPLGLSGSIPMILQSRKVSYAEQAVFSFVFWPFSVKLLWAPFVDSFYFRRFGRRKTWLIPTQYMIGIFMLLLSYQIESLMRQGNIDMLHLTVIFFLLNFLAATQDIAVDGWALTMLSRFDCITF